MAMQSPIVITLGDPAGVGPEIIAKAFRDAPDVTSGCFVAGDLASMRRAARVIAGDGVVMPVALIASPDDLMDVPPRSIALVQVAPGGELVEMGRVSAAAGLMAGQCVLWAAQAALAGRVSAMVTAPLHKEALHAAGLPYSAFPGHTEMLQAQAAAFLGKPVGEVPVRMMLANEELRTVLVSIHVSLRDALDAVSLDNVLQTLIITDQSLRAVLGRTPAIAVAGLNPHAGEGGLFGREEIDIITPAIAAACRLGIDARGPFSPDTVFRRARRTLQKPAEFDVVVAMYHDQGLIPVKYLGVDKGVNVTLGLPLWRTSPDHGTAFDIAGSGSADASSLIEAIRMARALSQA
jgi:4-hydroxythreonine-4-phosphate dehydrogenase